MQMLQKPESSSGCKDVALLTFTSSEHVLQALEEAFMLEDLVGGYMVHRGHLMIKRCEKLAQLILKRHSFLR